MNSKTKLELLRSLRKVRRNYRNRISNAEGFTLVEVLVVAGILAILFASLVPNLLKAQARAGASAAISEAAGQARACQAVVNSGIGLDTFSGYGLGDNTKTDVICDGATTTAVAYRFNSRTFRGEIVSDDGIICPDTAAPFPVTATSGQRANYVTIGVSTDGNLDCALTNG